MGYFFWYILVIIVTAAVACVLDPGDEVVAVDTSRPLYMRQAEQVAADAENAQRNSEVEGTLAAIDRLLAQCRKDGGDESEAAI